MKSLNIFLRAITVAFVITGSLFANSNGTNSFPKNSVENLKIGSQSDNTGLRKSAIYIAGKYKVKAITEALINQLENEKDEAVKKLIILSLYQINVDDSNGLVKDLAIKE